MSSQNEVAEVAKHFNGNVVENEHPRLGFDVWASKSFCEVAGLGAQSTTGEDESLRLRRFLDADPDTGGHAQCTVKYSC